MKNLLVSRAVALSIFFAIAFQIGAISAFAVEGGGGTGGGGTHTCLSHDGLSTKSVELYDLYEGREARRYKLVDPAGKTANELLNDAMKKIFKASPQLAYAIKEKLDYYVSHKAVVENKEFEVIKDAKIIFIDKGCQYQQIAQWRDDYEAIFIDGSINDLFRQSQLNIAALALHEAIYAYDRENQQAVNSNYTRKLVAQAFSNAEFGEMKFNNQMLLTLITISYKNKYKIRINSVRNKPATVDIGMIKFSEDCKLLGQNSSCEIPININNNINTNLGINPLLYYVKNAESGHPGARLEILENEIPVYVKKIEYISRPYNIKKEGFSFLMPYSETLEKEILSLPL